MNCWHCKTELIWGADADIDGEDFQPVLYQEYSVWLVIFLALNVIHM